MKPRMTFIILIRCKYHKLSQGNKHHICVFLVVIHALLSHCVKMQTSSSSIFRSWTIFAKNGLIVWIMAFQQSDFPCYVLSATCAFHSKAIWYVKYGYLVLVKTTVGVSAERRFVETLWFEPFITVETSNDWNHWTIEDFLNELYHNAITIIIIYC